MSYVYTDTAPATPNFNAAQQHAGLGHLGQQPLPLPETFIDLIVSRINILSESATILRVKMDKNADRVFGPAPEVRDSATQGIGHRSDTSLFEKLESALNYLEHEHGQLAIAAERNCWAL